jgi:hypothetical protein
VGQTIPESHPLHRLFRGITEHTFLNELGIGDPRLVGYVAGLLARFVPAEALAGPGDTGGGRLNGLAAMLNAASNAGDPERLRESHRQVGDFTLFWTGVFPEALPRLARACPADGLLDWREQGKRAYHLASTGAHGDEALVLRRLSDQFELCAFGLSRVRREWEALPAAAGSAPAILT